MKHSTINRKESIILSSIDIIDKFGLSGLTIREIAEKEHITDSAIYRHFKSKDEIILGIIDYYSLCDSTIRADIEHNMLHSEEALKYAMVALADFYETNPKTSGLTNSYDLFIYNESTREKMINILVNRSNFIKTLLKEGVALGHFKSETNIDVISDIILGSVRELILHWRISGYSFNLTERLLSTLEVILKPYRC